MKLRTLSLALVLALLIGMMPAACAETLPWDMQPLGGTSLSRALVRAYGDGYEYFTYEPSAFSATGRMGGISLDLDNDGREEYLSVILEEDQTVTLNVHDQYESDSWMHTASAALYEASLTCNIQANDVFLKHNGYNWVIFAENWTQENGVADGAAWNFQAYAYDGTGLVLLSDESVDGTDIFGTLEDWRSNTDLISYRPELQGVAATIDSYDFNITEVYWGNPICEQDGTLTVLCRLMSVQEIPYDDIWQFTGAGGSRLFGYRSMIIDCSDTGYALPAAYTIEANLPPESDADYDFESDYEDDAYEDVSEYIIPDSDVRELTADELSQYDKDTLALIRNEILARYGYPFQKQKYRDYFGAKSWYTRNESFTYGMLTSLEMENIELIKKLESH